ncbi:MAG: hypothetical protein WBB01_11590 [Phormidesmis sp.]
MNYTSSTHASSADRAIASILVAGVMFVLGYTVVRASMAASTPSATAQDSDIEMVIPHEAALWADFGVRY